MNVAYWIAYYLLGCVLMAYSVRNEPMSLANKAYLAVAWPLVALAYLVIVAQQIRKEREETDEDGH